MALWVWCLLAYVVGSLPFGVWIPKGLAGKDPRQTGSGNVGTTNVWRSSGVKVALVVFAVDVLKAGALCMVYQHTQDNQSGLFCLALSLLMGQIFSCFLKFRGGKGVAVMFGILISLHPMQAFVFLGFWLINLWWTRYASAATFISVAGYIVWTLVGKQSVQEQIFACLAGGLIFYAHRENLRRLLHNREPSMNKKGEKRW